MTENDFWAQIKSRFNETDIESFKTWKSVQSIPLYSFGHYEQYYANDFIRLFSKLNDADKEQWKKILKEPVKGHAEDSYHFAKRLIMLDGSKVETTPWALKSAHHALMFTLNSKSDIMSFEQIVEFGPGIGETCRVINDLGFKGKYYLYDLPEVLRISTYYNSEYENVSGVTHYSQIDSSKKTLFIGTWSISETPFSYRDEVFTHFKDADYLLIYQNKAFEYENSMYFMIKFPQLINRDVKIVDMPWLSNIAGGNKYLFVE